MMLEVGLGGLVEGQCNLFQIGCDRALKNKDSLVQDIKGAYNEDCLLSAGLAGESSTSPISGLYPSRTDRKLAKNAFKVKVYRCRPGLVGIVPSGQN
jgi:hypothetical protein